MIFKSSTKPTFYCKTVEVSKPTFPNGFLERICGRYVPKVETYTVVGNVEYEPLIIEIEDKIFLKNWFDNVLYKKQDYKKDIDIIFDGKKYSCKGAWPCEIIEENKAKIVFDFCQEYIEAVPMCDKLIKYIQSPQYITAKIKEVTPNP